MSRVPVAALGGILAAALVGALAQASLPAAGAVTRAQLRGQTRGQSEAASGAVLVCPDVGYIKGTEQTTVGIDSTTAAAGGSAATLPATSPGATATQVLSASASSIHLHPPAGPLVIEASGPLASGLVAEQVSRANKTDLRGWADVACTAPQADQWFVGPGTLVGESPVLTLSNPDSSVALVNVTVLTPSGAAGSQAGQGITVRPYSVLHIQLATLAPDAAATAVQVLTITGRVSAALRDVRTKGSTFLGTDYAPPTGSPNPVVTIPGVPGALLGRLPARTLMLANPGALDTTVRVAVTSDQGTFVPTALASIDVPAGEVRVVPLNASLPGMSSSMLTVTASGGSGSVLAGVLVDAASTTTAIHEIAYLGAAPALTGTAVAPVNPISSTITSYLLLAAPQGAGSVEIAAGPGQSGHRQTIPAGQSVQVSLRLVHSTGEAAYVTPNPGSGPVYAVRFIVEQGALGPLIAAFPLISPPATYRVPPVVAAPLSGL